MVEDRGLLLSIHENLDLFRPWGADVIFLTPLLLNSQYFQRKRSKTDRVTVWASPHEFIPKLFEQPIKSQPLCEFNNAFFNWQYQAHLIWKIGRSRRPTWKCVVSTIMFVCQFCATLLPTAPYLLHDPFVADTLFCLRKNASKSGIQGGGFANTQCGHLMCFREKNLPFIGEKRISCQAKTTSHHVLCAPLQSIIWRSRVWLPSQKRVSPTDEERQN